MSTAFEELRRRLAEIGDLSAAASLLAWDQQVMMPPRGAASRAEHLATLKQITHEKFISPEIGRLLEELAPFEEAHEYDSFEASLIRVTRRDWEKARKVPSELRAEMSRAASLALPVWVDARANNDFASFLPALRENVELRRRYIACFDGDYPEPYDAVLDDFERGMTTRRGAVALRLPQGAPGAARQARCGRTGAGDPGDRSFPIELQKQFELEVVRRVRLRRPGLADRPDRSPVRERYRP